MSTSTTQVNRTLKFLISGGGRGLGRGLARSLLQQGHSVFLMDSNQEELKHTLTSHLPKCREQSPKTFGSYAGDVADVSSIQSIKSAIASAANFHNQSIDVLVCNAAKTNPYWKSGDGLIEDVDPSEWKEFVEVNLNGTFYLTQAALPFLRKSQSGPSIINVSSTRSKQSEPFQEGYAST